MLVKWAIGGAVIGGIIAINTDTNIGSGVVFGAAMGAAFRKWIFWKFWM